MQTAGANTGMAGSSLLLHSLRVYLNNQNRLQPIIGLTSVTECVKAGPGGNEVLYLCDVCACRVSKADIRSHIMGSLHRCNYIKVCHPYIMGGREVTDLSKLAWPLMDLARVLEKKEGPGDVQVMEMDPAAYKMMVSLRESEAISFLHAVKDGRWAQLYSSVQSASSLEALTQSQKPSVDFTQSQKPSVDFTQSQMLSVDFSQPQTLSVDFSHSQKQPVDSTPSQKQSFEMTRSPAPTWMTPTTGQWENSVLLPGTYQMPLKPPGQSEHSNVFLHGYTDTNPIIGLDRVVECRGEEDGRSHCFLCHSCRVKSLHDGIIHHLTSSSHYYNYMVEMQPECEGAMRNCERHLYLSMAQTVEQQDGRGQVKVKWLPTSLCSQLTGNSYHWCIKKLGDGNVWMPADKQTTRWSIQGPSDGTAEASGTGGTQEHASEQSRQGRKRKRKSENNPVFKVSLPLNYGPLVLERTSFSLDALPVLPPADPTPPSPSLEPHQEYISGPLFIDRPGDFCEDSDALAEGQHNLFGADTDRLAEVQELQHELFGTDTVAEEQELQNELFGGDPDTLAEENQHEEQYWTSWDTLGHQEARDGYFTDRHYSDQQRNPAEDSRRINGWFN